MATVDIYNTEFQKLLREFCHFYQTPFLENNIPKTCKNAAKIYYRLKDDKMKIAERFEKSKLIDFIKSISPEEIDDTFNPFKMRNKWQKFFRIGSTKITNDTDRTLKNEPSRQQLDYITDSFQTFNEM